MSMSDCIKCWDTPCTCGYEYRNWPYQKRVEFAKIVLGVTSNEIYSLDMPDDHPMKDKITSPVD